MARRFNPGGDLDQDYIRIVLQNSVAAYPITIGACFARELDDGNFQTIAQAGQAGTNNNRHLIGVPSSTDVFRGSSGDSGGTFRSVNTTGALVNEKWYVGVARFVSSTSRQAQRTGAALATNTQSAVLGNVDELLIARVGQVVATFESFPGWLQWVTYWRTTPNDQVMTELCENWIDPRRFAPDLILAHVDLSERKAVVHAPRGSLIAQIVGDPAWTTFTPYSIPIKRRRIFVPTGGAAVTGDLDATEDADTAAIAGEVDVSGDLAATEGADVAAIAGEVDVSGDLAATEAQDVAAIDGSVIVTGDLSATEAADTASIAGEVDVQGDLAAVEGSDVAAISGGSEITGDMDATEAADVAAIEGGPVVTGDLAATEGSDTAAIDGQVIVTGDMAAIEEGDVAAINGTNDIFGDVDATEQPDTAAIDGSVLVQGDLSATDAPDVAAMAGGPVVTGDLSVTEANDSAEISGFTERVGSMAATESGDTAEIIGFIGELSDDRIPRDGLPYVTAEAVRFGIPVGRFKNLVSTDLRTKNGLAAVDFVENVETSPPKSIVPGQ